MDEFHIYDDTDDSFFDDDVIEEDDVYDDNVIEADAGNDIKVSVYTIMREEDIRLRTEKEIEKISAVLSVSVVSSTALIVHYRWDVQKLEEEWFSDEDGVRGAAGLLTSTNSATPPTPKKTCPICFDCYPYQAMTAASACGHLFCNSCWNQYIHTAVSDGPGCLTLRCPEPSCRAFVGRDMVDSLASVEDKGKYTRFLLRSYVEHNKAMRWCSAPGCELAIEFDTEGGGCYEVGCDCGHTFCWNCIEAEEAHRPVNCDTVSNWMSMMKKDQTNTWMLANSKPCPKCARPIEKNRGCMHMRCSPPCEFQFCWLCLGPWSEHGKSTGGFYACNSYERERKAGTLDESEQKAKMARVEIEKYSHYYNRWVANHSSRQKALSDLRMMKSENLLKLSDTVKVPINQLIFVIDAWKQIAECRRVLKWSYAYGFYIPDNEGAKIKFFEYLQGEAEVALEKLHQCTEKELQAYLSPKVPVSDAESDPDHCTAPPPFADFHERLASLTCVTRKYFENLTQALESGLQDVNCTWYRESRGSRRGSRNSVDEDYYWTCGSCTYVNFENPDTCDMCTNPRMIEEDMIM